MPTNKVASLIAEIGANTTPFETGAKKVKNELGAMGSQMQNTALQNAKVFSALGIAVTAIGYALKETIKSTLEYDSSVRQLAEVSGTGAEEASRLLQVMDDFKLTAGDVNAATRAMTKQGLSPTLETLAQLSDQYNALNPGQERAEFLMKNFGRTGLQFAEAMGKGGDALRQMGTEVEKSLIRTDAQIAKTRLAELEFDNWQDKIEGLKVTIGSGLIGVLDGSTVAIAKSAQEIYKQANGAYFNTNRINQMSDAQRNAWEEAQKLATEQYLLSQGMDIAKKSTDGLTLSLEEQAAVDKEISDLNIGMISLINDIQNAEDNYTEKSLGLTNDRREIEAKLAEFRRQGYWEQSDQIQGALSDLEKIKQKEADLAKERDKQTLQFVSNILAEELARGGWTQTEFDAFAKQQEDWGLWSADVVAKARTAWMEADKIAASINNIPSEKNVNINIYGGVGDAPYGPPASSKKSGNVIHRNADGGSFLIPQSYGNEGFRMGNGDTASGGERVTITPKGQSPAQTAIDYKKMARAIVTAFAQAGG